MTADRDIRPLRPADERVPPHNDPAEMALLGAILFRNRAYEQVVEFLKPEMFANRVHGRIFEAIGKVRERGSIADPITLKQYFEADADLAEIGGYEYLIRLAGSVGSILNAEDYGRTIHDLHVRRQMISLAEDMLTDAYREDIDSEAPELVAKAGARLQALEGQAVRGGFRSIGEAAVSQRDRIDAAAKYAPGQLMGISTTLKELDQKTFGLVPGDLTVVAGRPGMGKSVVAGQISFEAALTKHFLDPNRPSTAALFSIEMSAEQYAARLATRHTRIAARAQTSPGLTNAELDALMRWCAAVQGMPLHIDDTPAITLSQIVARCRKLRRETGHLDLVVIDYLQIMGGLPAENRAQALGQVTMGLKNLARDLDVPVVLLSQLSRAVEAREDKRPQLSDLRESGSIEQDADAVWFLYRPEYYLERSEPQDTGKKKHEVYLEERSRWLKALEVAKGKVEILVDKQRFGPACRVVGVWDPEWQAIRNLDEMQGANLLDRLPDGRPMPPDNAWGDLGGL